MCFLAALSICPTLSFPSYVCKSVLYVCISIGVWRLLKKLGIKLPYDPTIPLLGTYCEKAIAVQDTCAPAVTAALYTIVRTWTQLRSLLTDEWIKKLWYVHTMEDYSAIRGMHLSQF